MEQVVRRAQGPSADLLLSKVPRDADAGDVYDAEHGVATVDLPHWLIYGEKNMLINLPAPKSIRNLYYENYTY